jgi:hypothetical protein
MAADVCRHDSIAACSQALRSFLFGEAKQKHGFLERLTIKEN